jgi:hypothetical protein
MVLRIRPTAMPSSAKSGSPAARRWSEVGVLGQQLDARAGVRRSRLTVTSSPSRATTIWPFLASLVLLHREQVAVEDAGVAHAHAAHLQQVVGRRGNSVASTHVGLVDVLLRQDRAAGGHAADQRQRQLRQAGQRQRVLLAARGVQRAQRVRLQADAARGAAHQFDHALAGQRLQVLLGGVGRLEAQFGGDLGARGRRAGALDGALHQVEDLLLARGELGASFHARAVLPCGATAGG